MFILVDDEDRENEGDLVVPAQMATPDAINFMARFGRGLICLAMDQGRINALGLPQVSRRETGGLGTAFTVSIEARTGITTGISAADRARTVQVAIDPASAASDLVTPGHVFPLAAREGGVLVRAGHTEAAVDISQLAGLRPAGVICEIMNDDGTMARLPDLIRFAQHHNLKIGTIADLIAYRRRTERLVDRIAETEIDSEHGGLFRLSVYRNRVSGAEHIALVKGDVGPGEGPVMVRMHALNVLDDLLGDRTSQRSHDLVRSMRMIGEAGRGVVVIIRDPEPTSLSDRLTARERGRPHTNSELRDYGVGAQILIDVGVKEMILLSNTRRTIIGLEGYGLSLVDQQPIPTDADEEIGR